MSAKTASAIGASMRNVSASSLVGNGAIIIMAKNQTTPKTYRIHSVRDFLKVPFERRRDCLREFEVWLQASDTMSALLDGIPAKMPNAFVWVDDGLHRFVATVVAGEERIPVVSGTIKGFENG